MRKGFNPQKDKKIAKLDFFHQVIVPVYIPSSEGYFKDSFKILQLHLESFFKTSHSQTFFTIINNGSSKYVQDYLDELFLNNKIHEIIHTENIGKLNAILKGISGHNFPLITISDADVLFLNNWQKATYDVFENFPKVGAVSPFPSSKALKQYNHIFIVDALFSKKVKFSKVKNPEAMKRFAHSIDNDEFFNEYNLKQYLTVENGNFKAVAGAGHFVSTYRREIFSELKHSFVKYSLGGRSENLILDIPIATNGFWRLATHDNYVYHMGNIQESWMDKEIENLTTIKQKIQLPIISKISNPKIINKLKYFLFRILVGKKIFWKLFLRRKGLNKDAINYY